MIRAGRAHTPGPDRRRFVCINATDKRYINQARMMRATVGSWSLALVLRLLDQLLTWTCSTCVLRFAIAFERNMWSWNRLSSQIPLDLSQWYVQVADSSGRRCRCSAQPDPIRRSRRSRSRCHRMGHRHSWSERTH